MNDYSDLFMVIGASLLYAILLIDINITVLHGTKYKTEREVEYTAIALAQDIIDEARWVPYDQFNTRFANTDSTYNTTLGDYRVTTKTLSNTLSGIGVSNDHIQLDVRVQSVSTPDTVSVLLSYVKN